MILYKDDEIIAFFYSEPQGPTQNPRRERLEFYCRRTSASTAPRTPRRACCPYAYVLITVLRVSRSCEHFPDGFDLHLLQLEWDSCFTRAQYEPASEPPHISLTRGQGGRGPSMCRTRPAPPRSRASPTCQEGSVVVTEAGSYLRLIDSCITQLKAQGPSRICTASKEEERSTRPAPPRSRASPTCQEGRCKRERSLMTTYWSESTLLS